MHVAAAVVAFLAGTAVSLGTSWVLVARLERIGERLGLSEALLGLLAALAANAPEISAAVAAITSRQQRLGAGVIIGSNVFNLAALLGLGAVVAGRVGLHRRVVVLGGVVAIWVAACCVAVVAGVLSPAGGLVLALAAVTLDALVLGAGPGRLAGLGMPRAWAAWLRSAVAEEKLDLAAAIRPAPAHRRDLVIACGSLLVVVLASITMERAAVSLGSRLAVPAIVVGGLLIAAVTSLPNAIAAVYLAARGRGAATLSTALNSNALNVTIGLLLPATITGQLRPSDETTLAAVWYAGLTVATLAIAYRARGLGRASGALVIVGYGAFAASLLALAYGWPAGPRLAVVAGLAMGAIFTTWLAFGARHHPVGVARHADYVSRRLLGVMHGESLLPGWPVWRLWVLGMSLTLAVAIVDAVLGPRVVLIGLLIVGPCSVLLTGHWRPTGLTGLWAGGLGIALGVPDGIWGTTTQFAFLGAVAVVAAASTVGAALIQARRVGPGRANPQERCS
jgi:cation:H+ antiporter